MFDLTVFDHVPDSDRGVSWDQHLYLSAFDRHLHAGDDERRLERVKLLTDAALEGIGRKPGRSVPAREWMTELLLEDMARAS